MRTKEEAREFVQNLGEPKFLLEGCKRYYDYEPRDAVYTVVSDFVSAHTSRVERATAVAALLLSWNARYYATRPEQKKVVAHDVETRLAESVIWQFFRTTSSRSIRLTHDSVR